MIDLTDEILVRVDENDNEIGQIFRKDLISDPDIFIRVVVVNVVNSVGQTLFGVKVRRMADPQWSVVGSGHVSINESPLEAAVRELFEESGLKARLEELLFTGKRLDKDLGYGTYVYHYEYLFNGEGNLDESNEEFCKYAWMTINELKQSEIPMSFGTIRLVKFLES